MTIEVSIERHQFQEKRWDVLSRALEMALDKFGIRIHIPPFEIDPGDPESAAETIREQLREKNLVFGVKCSWNIDEFQIFLTETPEGCLTVRDEK